MERAQKKKQLAEMAADFATSPDSVSCPLSYFLSFVIRLNQKLRKCQILCHDLDSEVTGFASRVGSQPYQSQIVPRVGQIKSIVFFFFFVAAYQSKVILGHLFICLFINLFYSFFIQGLNLVL